MAIDKIFNDGNVDGIADNIFNAVNNSVSEVKQMQQRKAAENAQMVVQSLKKIDTDIREKYDNVTTTLEKRIITIKDGRDGINGKDGRDGKNGKDGRDGKDGKTGPQGPKGQDGLDGLDGISVSNANIDFDGSLIIALSDGREINVGEVVSTDLQERIKVITSGGAGGGGGGGSGDVVGPASAVNSSLVAFDGITGKLVKNASLTANNVLLGNGTSAPLLVAPSTAGNVLTSNGTTWQSTAPAGGVTPIVENQNTISTNKIITAGSNGMSVGPMTINTGVTLTVGSSQRYVVL